MEYVKPAVLSGWPVLILPLMNGEYMTKAEAAEYAKISIATLERLMKKRPPLPHIKLERRVLFRKQDIDHWLEEKLVK